MIHDDFVCVASKQALLEILDASEDRILRVLALDALRQSWNPTEEFKRRYKTEQDEEIKYDMQTTMLDAKRSSFSDMLSTREAFNRNPEEFENLLQKM